MEEHCQGTFIWGFEPFVKAQDVVCGMERGEYSIRCVSKKKSLWRVSYCDKCECHITMKMMMDDGEGRIDDVYFDDSITFKEEY